MHGKNDTKSVEPHPSEIKEGGARAYISEFYEAILFLFSVRAAPAFPARRNIVKPNQVYVIALTVLCNLEQIEYSQEAGFPR
jgi:hypothetical protein